MANLRHAEVILHEEASLGRDYVFFPEMSFTGFSMNTGKTGEAGRETVEHMAGLCRKYAIGAGFGWVALPGDAAGEGKAENRYTILDRDGRLISEYTKLHPFSFAGEDKYFRGGDEIKTYMLGDIPAATFICYDLRFPEEFRQVAEDVHLVIIPANWPAKRADHWKTLLRARAIENQIYILGINCVGQMDGQMYSGDSMVVCPDGRIQSSEEVIEPVVCPDGRIQGPEGGSLIQPQVVEKVIRCDIIDDVESYREEFPVLKDRIRGGSFYGLRT